LQLQTQQMITSKIRSDIKYLIKKLITFLCSFGTEIDEKFSRTGGF